MCFSAVYDLDGAAHNDDELLTFMGGKPAFFIMFRQNLYKERFHVPIHLPPPQGMKEVGGRPVSSLVRYKLRLAVVGTNDERVLAYLVIEEGAKT